MATPLQMYSDLHEAEISFSNQPFNYCDSDHCFDRGDSISQSK